MKALGVDVDCGAPWLQPVPPSKKSMVIRVHRDFLLKNFIIVKTIYQL
jgi:hypothetical protein